MDAVFVRSVLRDTLLLKPQLLGSNYREVLLAQLRRKVEAVCSRHGYVMPGSVALHKVSSGRLEAVSLNGDIKYDVQYYANVCNPPVGTVLRARVVDLNRFGVLAHCGLLLPDGDFVPVVEIIVTRQGVNGATSEIDLDALKKGDEINVEILGKKFELNDDKISVIGRAVIAGPAAVVKGKKAAAAAAAAAASDAAAFRNLPPMYSAPNEDDDGVDLKEEADVLDMGDSAEPSDADDDESAEGEDEDEDEDATSGSASDEASDEEDVADEDANDGIDEADGIDEEEEDDEDEVKDDEFFSEADDDGEFAEDDAADEDDDGYVSVKKGAKKAPAVPRGGKQK